MPFENVAPKSSNPQTDLVWHYTSLATLQTILASKTLLSTEVNFLNDPEETKTAEVAIDRAMDALAEEPELRDFVNHARLITNAAHEASSDRGPVRDGRFVLCASRDGDSLYAWRTYVAPGTFGCAIGMDRNAPLAVLQAPEDLNPNAWQVHAWADVEYAVERQLEAAMTKLRDTGALWEQAAARARKDYEYDDRMGIILREVSDAMHEIRAIAKHPSYADEKEVRLTVDRGISTQASRSCQEQHCLALTFA